MHTLNDVNTQSAPKQHKLSLAYRFFCWCSGARIYILKQCPSDYNKYYGIGVVVFLTGLMASLSGGYAIFTVFKSFPISVAFGLLWGFLIFSIDWYLVASLRKHQKTMKELGFAAPRLILAILIAFVISKPLEMKLFEKEIDQQILFNHQRKTIDYQQLVSQEFDEITRLEQQNEELQKALKQKEEQRNKLFDMIIAEAEGLSPTRIIGKGPVYREKRDEYEKIEEELLQLRDRNIAQIQINNIELEKQKQRRDIVLNSARIINQDSNGFLARIDAMSDLSDSSNSVRIASIFIILLFIVIESAPIIVKLLSSRGPYDDMLEAEEYLKQVEIRKIILQAELTEDHRIDLHRMLEKERNEKLYEVEKDHILTEAKVLSEINKLKVQKWKDEEYGKLQSQPLEKLENDSKDIKHLGFDSDNSDPGKHFTPEPEINLKDNPIVEEEEVDKQVISNELISGMVEDFSNFKKPNEQ